MTGRRLLPLVLALAACASPAPTERLARPAPARTPSPAPAATSRPAPAASASGPGLAERLLALRPPPATPSPRPLLATRWTLLERKVPPSAPFPVLLRPLYGSSLLIDRRSLRLTLPCGLDLRSPAAIAQGHLTLPASRALQIRAARRPCGETADALVAALRASAAAPLLIEQSGEWLRLSNERHTFSLAPAADPAVWRRLAPASP